MAVIFLLTIVAIGFVAANKFGALAESKGYQRGKAKRYPFLLMLFGIGGAVSFYLMTAVLGAQYPQWGKFMQAIYIVGNIFVIALNLLVLRMAYRNMFAAPDAKNKERGSH